MSRTCTIVLLDEVFCAFNGLHPDHITALYDKFSVYAPGYRFNPKYKLGRWDGKIRYFHKTGKTFINLLDDIIPIVISFGYKISIKDLRTGKSVFPPPIDKDFFSYVIDPASGQPWEIRPYQVEMVNHLLAKGSGIGIAGTGAGKEQPLYSRILTPLGWITMGEIAEGKQVITPFNTVANVIGVFPQGENDVYRITFEDGASCHCGLSHLWTVNFHRSIGEYSIGQWTIDTLTLMSLLQEDRTAISIDLPDLIDLVPTATKHKRMQTLSEFFDLNLDLMVPPFVVTQTTADEEVAKNICEIAWSLGQPCRYTKDRSSYIVTCNFYDVTKTKPARRITSIEKIGHEQTQCIKIDDPRGLYITDDFIVTHNTSMCAALAKSYEDAGGLRSIIIVPDLNLTKQTIDDYKFFELNVGEYSGDQKDYKKQHIVSTWQSLQYNPTFIQNFDVVIVDECHGLRGNVISKIVNEHGKNIAHRFGVTGTLPKEQADALAVKVALGEVLYEIPAHLLIEQGYLAKPHIDVMQLEVDLHEQYQLYLDEQPSEPLTYRRFKNSYFPDWTSELKYLQTHPTYLQWIADYIDIVRQKEKGNVLCLVNGISMGRKLEKLIPDSVFVYGQDDVETRREVYKMFDDNNNIVVLATVNIASTGLDIKRIFNLVFVHIGKSFIRVIQSIGRGLRKATDKDSVHITDICADLKFSKRHLQQRVQYYKEAKYPYKKHKVKVVE